MAVAMSFTRQSPPRWLVVGLLVSVGLNLAILGATGVGLWRQASHAEAPNQPHLLPNLLGYASTLPKARREELWNVTEEQRRIVRPLRLELREAREKTLRLLASGHFDKQAYQVAQERLLVIDRKAREAVHQLYAEIAANLTAEERQGFLRWREKRRPMHNLLDEPEKQASEQR